MKWIQKNLLKNKLKRIKVFLNLVLQVKVMKKKMIFTMIRIVIKNNKGLINFFKGRLVNLIHKFLIIFKHLINLIMRLIIYKMITFNLKCNLMIKIYH